MYKEKLLQKLRSLVLYTLKARFTSPRGYLSSPKAEEIYPLSTQFTNAVFAILRL